jgi:hypothetical protein
MAIIQQHVLSIESGYTILPHFLAGSEAETVKSAKGEMCI